jgi:hypothetical protein
MNIEATPAARAGQVCPRCQRRRTYLIAGPKSLTSARCLRFCSAESCVRPNALGTKLHGQRPRAEARAARRLLRSRRASGTRVMRPA